MVPPSGSDWQKVWSPAKDRESDRRGGCSGITLRFGTPPDAGGYGGLGLVGCDNEINFKLGRVYLKLKDVPNTEKYLKECLKGKTKKEYVDKIVAAFRILGIKN